MKYLLVAIDVLSKYAWVSPVKDKTGKVLLLYLIPFLKMDVNLKNYERTRELNS